MNYTLIESKTIFISALDWGLGHASRCVPIIRRLEKNNKIIIGITPLTKIIFDEEFPHLEKIDVPPYNIVYSKLLPLWVKLIADWPRISRIIKAEKKLLDEILMQKKIDVVISDSRFGFRSKKTKSILITHQLFLKSPFAASFSQKMNKKFILNFDEIWVPDFEDYTTSLSSDLSHGKHFHKNVKFIGPQSRLIRPEGTEIKYDYLLLVSGPEPQQSIFRNVLIDLAKNKPALKFALVTPLKRSNHNPITENINVFLSPDSQKLSELIMQSRKIICRSGYSSLMDLHHLGKKEIILIPTPGQTEQEYLATYWKKNFGAEVIDPKKIAEIKLS